MFEWVGVDREKEMFQRERKKRCCKDWKRDLIEWRERMSDCRQGKRERERAVEESLMILSKIPLSSLKNTLKIEN